MKENHSEIICILDRSGSMSSIQADAIGGFNTFLSAQKQVEGTADFSLVLFDTEYLMPYQKIAITDAPLLDDKTFVPRGGTALYDAIGKTIDEVGIRLAETVESERPEKIIVAILTDGEENSSRHYSRQQIADKIKHQKNVYAWDFIFLAAGQDAVATATTIQIDAASAYDFKATGDKLQHSFLVISEEVTYSRSKSKMSKMTAHEQAQESGKHYEKMQTAREKLVS